MRSLLLIFLLAFSLGTIAQQRPVDSETIGLIKNGVAKASAGTATISSDFTQEKEMSILNDKIISSGKFYFKKERLLRWEYLKPFEYQIAIRGDVISIKDEGKVSSFNTQSNKVFTEVNRIIIGSVNGTLLEDPGFKADYKVSNGNYIVSLTPLAASLKESLEKIVIYFSKTDFTVDKLELMEPAGDFTRITFTLKQLNKPIPDEVFILR